MATAAEAGFAGMELVLGEAGPLHPETPLPVFSDLADRAAEVGVRIVSLATGVFWECNYASPRGTDRQRARDLTIRMLDQAAAAQAGAILVVPAVVGRQGEPRPRVAYDDALHYACDALRVLRHEAEARGVVLAIENVWNRFLPVAAGDDRSD